MCMCVCVCVCVRVYRIVCISMINRKGLNVGTQNFNMMFYLVIDRTRSIDIGHCAIKVKVTEFIFKLSPFATVQTVITALMGKNLSEPV